MTVTLILIVMVYIRPKLRKKVCLLYNIILLLLQIVLLQAICPMTLNTYSHNPVNIEHDMRSNEIIEDDIDMKREEDRSSHMCTTQSSVVKEITYATLSDIKETKPSSSKAPPKPLPKVPPVKYEDIDFKATQVGVHTEFIVW